MGVSRVGWMDDEEWAEYQMTEEYRYELTHEPDYDVYPDDLDVDYYDRDVEQIECDCGDIVDLWFDTNHCDACDQIYNAWGQKLKPYDEWEDDY